MVQPHLTSSSLSCPLQPRPAFEVTLPLPTKPVRDGTSAGQAETDFRADLLSATRNLRAFAMSLVGDQDRADDLVQDTIVRALQKQDGFEPGTKLQAWLFTIMRNLFYSGYRKHKREVEDVDGLYAAKLSTLPEQPGCVEFAALRLALSQLSDEQREAVLLVGAEGLTYEETAEVCGTKVGTIKSRVNRARKRLAELLGHRHDSDGGPDGVTQAALGPSMGGVLNEPPMST
jgi:RNA polymerase sigma-70 factor, ECF subfamily